MARKLPDVVQGPSLLRGIWFRLRVTLWMGPGLRR